MGVYAKGMFMPESCNEWGNGTCPFLDSEIYDCDFNGDSFYFLCVLTENEVENIDMRPKWCPLVECEAKKGFVGHGKNKREVTILCAPDGTVIEGE